MTKKVQVGAAIVLLFCLIGWTGYGRASNVRAQMWEYHIDPVPPADMAVGIQQPPAQAALMQRILSQRGAEGWELVTVGEDFGSVYFYFKRPK